MSERSSYEAGTPNWVEFSAPDIEAAVEFYEGLFGWEIPESENPEQTGGYRRATKDGKDVAGMMPFMGDNQHPVWSSYVAVEDAAATVAKAKEHGATVVAEPMEVLDLGKMAFFLDPTGAAIGVWEAGAFHGAALVNEVGAFGWNELNSRDVAASKEFYGAVFGWEHQDDEMPGFGTYTTFKLGEKMIAGMLDINGRVPDEVPAHWLVYFCVEDTDATLEKIKAAGGSVAFGPTQIPAGYFAVAKDPWGAVLAVISGTEE